MAVNPEMYGWEGFKINEFCNYPYSLGCDECEKCLPSYSEAQIQELAHITFDEAQDRFGLIDLHSAPECIRQHFKTNIEAAEKDFADEAEDRAMRLNGVRKWLEDNFGNKKEEPIMPAESSTKDMMYEYDAETNTATPAKSVTKPIQPSGNVKKAKEIWAIIETRCSVDGTSSVRDLCSDIYGDLHYSSLDAEAFLNAMYEEYLRINKTMNLGLILDLTHDEDGKNPIFKSRFLRRCAGCPDVETIVTYTIKKLEVSV